MASRPVVLAGFVLLTACDRFASDPSPTVSTRPVVSGSASSMPAEPGSTGPSTAGSEAPPVSSSAMDEQRAWDSLMVSANAGGAEAATRALAMVSAAELDRACSPAGMKALSWWVSTYPSKGVDVRGACEAERCFVGFTSVGVRTALGLRVFFRRQGALVSGVRCEHFRAG